VATLVVVTGAVAPQAALPPPPVPTGPMDDPAAIRSLDRALEALGPAHVSWLEYAIRLKMDLPGLGFEGEGDYRLGPDHRFRMEVRTHVGKEVGTLLNVSDGVNLWQARRAGDGPWASVTRLCLQDVIATINAPGASPSLRSEFFGGPMFSGGEPLVFTLRNCFIWVKQESVRRAEGDRVELTGVWPPARLQELPPDKPWPAGLPRRCLLSLDAATLWPHRLEWWGPGSGNDADVLLAEVEFCSPVVNRPLSPEQCARTFAFDPGDAEVKDRTEDVMNILAERAKFFAARESAARP
jgi:hypothetical protein